jgi:hypothetical protein
MMSSNAFVLTQALKGVFVDAKMTDESNNKSGPSFSELTRMEEFWPVEKNNNYLFQLKFFFFFNSI